MSSITPQILLKAYAAGIFPMAESADDSALYWIEPELRGVIPLDDFHVPRSLAKQVRRRPFEIRIDSHFAGVIDGCAERTGERRSTWINGRIRALYCQLHKMGFCHSVECWQADALVGGLYGVSIGAAFFGESMFCTERDASKVALKRLCEERRALLAAIDPALSTEMRLERIIRAYIEPHIRLCSEPAAHDYVKLLARFITENSELTRRIYSEILEPVRSLYVTALAEVLPALPKEELQRLFSFMVVLMASAPADSSYQSLTGHPAWPKEPDQLVDQLVGFISAGFLQRARQGRSAVRQPRGRRTSAGRTASARRNGRA